MNLMISEDEDEYVLMLKQSDFPPNYVNFMHPSDYNIFQTPFTELFFHRKKYHNRIFLRICFKLDNEIYIPLTFIIDTGCPMYLYLCPKAKEFLSTVIKKDEFDIEYIVLPNSKKFLVDETPHIHHNVNIIGLMAINYFGFYISNDQFAFENLPEHF